jgi:hypothetical protein
MAGLLSSPKGLSPVNPLPFFNYARKPFTIVTENKNFDSYVILNLQAHILRICSSSQLMTYDEHSDF